MIAIITLVWFVSEKFKPHYFSTRSLDAASFIDVMGFFYAPTSNSSKKIIINLEILS